MTKLKYNKYLRPDCEDNLKPLRVANYNIFLQELDKQNQDNIKNNLSAVMPNIIDTNSQDKTYERFVSKCSPKECCPNNTILSSIKPLTIDINTCNSATDDILLKFFKTFKKVKTTDFNEVNFTPNDGTFNAFKANSTKSKREILKTVHIDEKINNIHDLLAIIDKYPDEETTEYNIDIHILNKIKKPLQNLNAMIGMKGLKDHIVDQILYYIQDLHKIGGTNTSADFMHTVIYGEPGTGKTEIAKIIGSIFVNLGILTKGIFNKVTRSDLIAGYLGQTAIKTKEVIKDSLGGVLFIDEAYALGNSEKRDSFSKECIDTLCEALSAHKENLMVIIAGYEKELQDCFFNYNKGLESRFTWRFETEEYNAEELYKIFLKMVTDIGWSIETNTSEKINIKWFEINKDNFKYYGRDIETLLSKTKIAHSRRVFCLKKEEKTKITLGDLENGYKIYLKNKDNTKKNKLSESALSMYS